MDSLRCAISYTWSEKHFSGGTVDFGIRSADDPKIEAEKKKILDRGMFIQTVRIY